MLGSDHPVIEVEGFSGPFDLLLRLVERRELDLLAIALAEVADQYLAHLSVARQRDPEHLSAFLAVAAKLLLIKSTLLLPAPPRQTPEETVSDPTDLTRRLQLYQGYRDAAEALAARDEANLRGYPRSPIPYRMPPRPAATLDADLLRAAFLVARQRPKPDSPDPFVAEPRVSVAEILAALQTALRQGPSLSLSDLVAPSPTPQRYVAAFLAILEAVRLGLADATQAERYGEIVVSRRQDHP